MWDAQLSILIFILSFFFFLITCLCLFFSDPARVLGRTLKRWKIQLANEAIMAQNPGSHFADRNIIFHADGYFYEEPTLELLDSFKTTLGNRFQRQMIHLSPIESKLKKTVELVLCVHGWRIPDRRDPMTLIVLGVSLSCHARNFRFQSFQIRLGFGEDDQCNPADAIKACPQVVAYAPFVQEERWNGTTANV